MDKQTISKFWTEHSKNGYRSYFNLSMNDWLKTNRNNIHIRGSPWSRMFFYIQNQKWIISRCIIIKLNKAMKTTYKAWEFTTVLIKNLAWLDPLAQVLFLWISKFANGKDNCYPSIKKLMEVSGIKSKQTVHTKIKILESKWFITKTQARYTGRRYSNNIYKINISHDNEIVE